MLISVKKSSRYNRDSLDIVRDILSVASVETRKTKIMYKANLSYHQVQKYLHSLLEQDLLNHDGNSFYLITKKGRQFIKLYDEYAERIKQLEEQVDRCNKERMLLNRMCSNHNSDCNEMNARKDSLHES